VEFFLVLRRFFRLLSWFSFSALSWEVRVARHLKIRELVISLVGFSLFSSVLGYFLPKAANFLAVVRFHPVEFSSRRG
jgi:hypothetical protein